LHKLVFDIMKDKKAKEKRDHHDLKLQKNNCHIKETNTCW